MQIAVEGKSVGFIDREGSSPSIPTQVHSRTTDLFYPIPLVQIHSHFSLTSLFHLFMLIYSCLSIHEEKKWEH